MPSGARRRHGSEAWRDALAVFIGLATSFVLGLRKPDTHTIASQMIGVAVPAFTLPAGPGVTGLSSKDLATGKPHLVNFFASWCVPCAAEAPQLQALAAGGAPVMGVALRDTPADMAEFLKRNGNPYTKIGIDPDSRIQIDFGSSGVPETFVVDGKGVIRFQKIGPIADAELGDIRAALKAAS